MDKCTLWIHTKCNFVTKTWRQKSLQHTCLCSASQWGIYSITSSTPQAVVPNTQPPLVGKAHSSTVVCSEFEMTSMSITVCLKSVHHVWTTCSQPPVAHWSPVNILTPWSPSHPSINLYITWLSCRPRMKLPWSLRSTDTHLSSVWVSALLPVERKILILRKLGFVRIT